MSVPLWAGELAAAFWDLAGGPGPFPRDLRAPIALAFPLSVVPLPGLRVGTVLAWLRQRGVAVGFGGPDRPLRACLVARADCGFVFLDAADDPAEQRFSLAHELAHYLRDYWRPRREAARQLGPRVLEVFDGARPPSPEERLHALLRGLRVGVHTHLLARDGRTPRGWAADAETAADRLAYELLAPAAAVLAGGGGRDDVGRRLRSEFGLPPGPADRYAALLTGPAGGATLAARLRRATESVSNSGRAGGSNR